MDSNRASGMSRPSDGARRISEAGGAQALPSSSRFGFQGPASVRQGNGTNGPRPSSRVGIAAAGSASNAVAGPSQSILGSKRSLSGAGIAESATSSLRRANGGDGISSSTAKRRHPSTSSATATAPSASSRGPTPSPSHDLSSLENEYRRRELLSQQAYEKLQQDYMARGREAEKHQQDKIAVLRQWESFNAEIEEEREAQAKQRKLLSEQVTALQTDNRELADRASRAETESAKSRQALQATRTDLALRISALEAELATCQAETENQRQHRQRIESQWREVEADFARERKAWQEKALSETNSDAVTIELSNLLSRTRKLESENLTLQHENKSLAAHKSSVQALKEHNRSLESKVGVIGELRRKLAESESTCDELRQEAEQWRSLSSQRSDTTIFEDAMLAFSDPEAPIPEINEPAQLTPKSLVPYISHLQGALSGFSSRSKALSERANWLRKRYTEAEDAVQEELDRRFKLEGELEKERTARLISERNRDTLSAEMESYKKLLDTFQQEAQNMSGHFDAATADHMRVLQEQLSKRDEELANVRRSLDAAESQLSNFTSSGSISSVERERLESQSDMKHKELLQALEEQKSQYTALEQQCMSLGKANDDLFARLGRGEFDQSKVRCLELANNPVSSDRVIRTSTLERLRKENDDLLAQIQELSKRGPAPITDDAEASQAGLVPAQALENLRNEYSALQQTMRDRDKAFDRLKQVFGAKAGEYVAAVKTLFGYDMHVVARGKIKLRSVYARTSKGTSLTFDSADDDVGSMRLIGEARAGAANVAHLKKYWLNSPDRSSVPCFLAALQLELYESTTQAARSGWADEEDE